MDSFQFDGESAMNRSRWSDAERATLVKHYAKLGASGMQKAGYLTDRPRGSLTKMASLMGLSYSAAKHVNEEPWPMPTMDLPESLACVQLKQWRGPVTHGPLSPAIGLAA